VVVVVLAAVTGHRGRRVRGGQAARQPGPDIGGWLDPAVDKAVRGHRARMRVDPHASARVIALIGARRADPVP